MSTVTTRTASEFTVIDSSGWLEYLTEDSKAAVFAEYLESETTVVVPSIVLFEVYRHLSKNRGKALADRFAAQALQHRVVPMDEEIALAAATYGLQHRLSPANSIVYATARVCEAQLITSNTHFRGLQDVVIP
jgi:predicted nucleic acid-binding protein